MNRKQLVLLLFLLLWGVTYGQSGDGFHWSKVQPPHVGVKTNLLWDVTSTINLGVEVKLARRYTLDLPVNLNAWSFSDEKKLKHFLVQPEVRWWSCESFYGHFFGLHGMYGHYNAGGLTLPFKLLPKLKKERYQGDLAGVGLSYGYQWLLSPRWSLEATLGVGYVRLDHERFGCEVCGEKISDDGRNYFGPTKAGISLIYIIK
ncbi:MAG: DUF3575 domain-containing protein [Proteiniphilum sp.]|jgi:hypothetical protein|nr:DUF3575 domain-containing protein [Proteiniphilum sp.]